MDDASTSGRMVETIAAESAATEEEKEIKMDIYMDGLYKMVSTRMQQTVQKPLQRIYTQQCATSSIGPRNLQ
jgi:hypothetical protein